MNTVNTVASIIAEAQDKVGVRKNTINVVRELCTMVGNADAHKEYVDGEPVIVIRVGLHPGKHFATTKAAAEYLAGSIQSFREILRVLGA